MTRAQRTNFKFQPDLLSYHKERKGIYVSNDGLRKVEKTKDGNNWSPMVRDGIEKEWIKCEYVFGALHAAQDECRRMMDPEYREKVNNA